jgi:hypothetical protein
LRARRSGNSRSYCLRGFALHCPGLILPFPVAYCPPRVILINALYDKTKGIGGRRWTHINTPHLHTCAALHSTSSGTRDISTLLHLAAPLSLCSTCLTPLGDLPVHQKRQPVTELMGSESAVGAEAPQRRKLPVTTFGGRAVQRMSWKWQT